MKQATDAVLDFVLGTDPSTYPANVVEQGKRCVADGVGVMLAGSGSAAATLVRGQIERMGGRREATVLGGGLRAPVALAARANGVAGHALDFDDTQLSNWPDRIFGLLTHPTIPPLAAALALAERMDASGARFLDAFLAGFEVECKIAEAINPDHYRRGFHSSGTIGTFGAVVAGIKLLGLDRRRAAHAIGLAASLSAGIRAGFGTMAKPLHVGRAAENGLLAAELAEAGFTADPAALDGPWGYFSVFGGGFDEEKIVGALGAPYSIIDPGVSVKPYPCGSLSHPSTDAMMKLVVENDVKPEQIAAIRIRAGSNILRPLRYGIARNELEAKFSLPFILSSVALRRKAGIHEFTDEFVASAPVVEMMRKVETVHDPEIEAKGFDRMRSVVEIQLADGRVLREAAEVYRGGPERPFTREELLGKFTECAEVVLDPARVEPAFRAIESIDRAASVRGLIGILDGDARPLEAAQVMA